jgi:hypothetical protein
MVTALIIDDHLNEQFCDRISTPLRQGLAVLQVALFGARVRFQGADQALGG